MSECNNRVIAHYFTELVIRRTPGLVYTRRFVPPQPYPVRNSKPGVPGLTTFSNDLQLAKSGRTNNSFIEEQNYDKAHSRCADTSTYTQHPDIRPNETKSVAEITGNGEKTSVCSRNNRQ